jgi:tetratricopeptide (TPR) repeat protein
LTGLASIYKNIDNSNELLGSIFGTNGFPELAVHYNGMEYYELLQEKNYNKIYNKSMKEIAELLPYLSVSLLENYNDSYVNLLPEKLQIVIRYYHGISETSDIEGCFEEYKTILLEVISFASAEVAQRYLDVLDTFSHTCEGKEEKLLEVANIIMDIQKYDLAMLLYRQISEKSILINDEYWQNIGICYYGLGEYQQALECLDRASDNKKTATYRLWCREAMENGN